MVPTLQNGNVSIAGRVCLRSEFPCESEDPSLIERNQKRGWDKMIYSPYSGQ